MKGIKNIIFDFGGVIINLDMPATTRELNKLGEVKFDSLEKKLSGNGWFDRFEKGLISETDFFSEIRKNIRFKGSDADLVRAWNAMLLDLPEHRLDVLLESKKNYRTFLLSNTNETHIHCFESDMYRAHGIRNFGDYFDKLYYSCRINMRKPDKEIFEYVLEKNNLRPEETVFIDDSVQHVKGAGDSGINAFLLNPNMEVGDLLKELKLL